MGVDGGGREERGGREGGGCPCGEGEDEEWRGKKRGEEWREEKEDFTAD